MRYLTLALLVLLFSCKKDQTLLETSTSATVSSDALLPLPYHSTSFVTDYPANGSVPPFTFTKALYSDTRVKRLQMTSRGNVNAPALFGPDFAYNFDYTFAYAPNKAIITRKYKKHTETTFSQPQQFECIFNANGHCTSITYLPATPSPFPLVQMSFEYSGKKLTHMMVGYHLLETGGLPSSQGGEFTINTDANGNVLSITPDYVIHQALQIPSVSYTYNLNKTGNYSYQPTQYLFSQWFSFLEVMQWLPMQVNERKSVNLSVKLLDWSSGTGTPVVNTVNQGQKYFNHQYDVNGNLTSYTYADGVAQKTTWQ